MSNIDFSSPATHRLQFLRIMLLTNIADTRYSLQITWQVLTAKGVWAKITPIQTCASLSTFITVVPWAYPFACEHQQNICKYINLIIHISYSTHKCILFLCACMCLHSEHGVQVHVCTLQCFHEAYNQSLFH